MSWATLLSTGEENFNLIHFKHSLFIVNYTWLIIYTQSDVNIGTFYAYIYQRYLSFLSMFCPGLFMLNFLSDLYSCFGGEFYHFNILFCLFNLLKPDEEKRKRQDSESEASDTEQSPERMSPARRRALEKQKASPCK